jgi:hypothetical protein
MSPWELQGIPAFWASRHCGIFTATVNDSLLACCTHALDIQKHSPPSLGVWQMWKLCKHLGVGMFLIWHQMASTAIAPSTMTYAQ